MLKECGETPLTARGAYGVSTLLYGKATTHSCERLSQILRAIASSHSSF